MIAVFVASYANAEKISWENLPKPVRSAARAHLPKFSQIEKKSEDGAVLFALDGRGKQGRVELEFAPDGKLLYAAKQKRFSELPDAIQAAINKHVADGKLGEITKIIEDDDVHYQLEVTRSGKQHLSQLDERGRLYRDEKEVLLNEVPLAVRKTLQTELNGSKIDYIAEVIEDDERCFEVEAQKNGKDAFLKIAPDGDLLGMEIAFEDLPEQVRQTIKEKAGKGKMQISKTSEDGEIYYEVVFTNGGKETILTIAEDGAMVSTETEITVSEAPVAVQNAIKERVGSAKIESITRSIEETGTFYEIDVFKEGKSETVRLTNEGALANEE